MNYELEKVAEGRLKIWVALAVEERAARGRDELSPDTIIAGIGRSPKAATKALLEKVRGMFPDDDAPSDEAIADNFVIVEPIEAEVV